jgi:type VI secretion system protein ImpG
MRQNHRVHVLDLARLDGAALRRMGRELEIYLYLDRAAPDLEHVISADTFRLGCVPIVNLYRQRAEPIQLTQTEFEYRVVPDARRPLAQEVYSVDRVVASAPGGEQVEFQPLFCVKHATAGRATRAFWQSARRAAEPSGGLPDPGTEVFLSLVDLDGRPTAAGDWTLDIQTTCLNRDMPRQLPFGGSQPRLQLPSGGALVARIDCLTAPTRTLRPALRRGTLWRLISHLSLNHLSLVERDDQAEALREILRLYDFADSPETQKMISGLVQVQSRRVPGRVASKGTAFCYGLEITVQLDAKRFAGSGLFLFASVLERFLALYCSVNSFSKFIATIKEPEGVLRRWPPRMGERILA